MMILKYTAKFDIFALLVFGGEDLTALNPSRMCEAVNQAFAGLLKDTNNELRIGPPYDASSRYVLYWYKDGDESRKHVILDGSTAKDAKKQLPFWIRKVILAANRDTMDLSDGK